MPLRIGGSPAADKLYLGADEVDRVVLGREPVFQRPVLPTLTATLDRSYDEHGAAARTLTATWVASPGSNIAIRRLSDNAAIPATTGTTAIFAAPTEDETIEITATNVEGAVHVDLPYWRWVAPVFSNVVGGHVVQPTTGARVPRITGDLTITPWLSPALTLAPEGFGFSSRQFARSMQTGNSDTRHFLLQGDPHTAGQGAANVDVTLSAQLRIDGVAVGATVTQRVRFSF